MRYAHTNLIAKDWRLLSEFYQTVFACRPVGPKRDLCGDWIEKMTGIEGVHIVGEHLALPGYGEQGPTLEIFSYGACAEQLIGVDTCGFSHIAFEVQDVERTVEAVVEAGGCLLGEIVSKEYGAMGTGTFVYAKDPEGNILEIQSWRR